MALNQFERDDKILDSLKQRGGTATAADVAADTGLPLAEVEQSLRRLISVYKSHLDVDDDGFLRYRFDTNFVRRGEEPGRRWHEFKKGAARVGKFVVKAGIMVTLIGYAVVFIAILLALSVAALAALVSSEDDGVGELLFIPFRLLLELLEFFFWIDVFSGGAYTSGTGRLGRRLSKRRHFDKPLYQRIFDYVFGPEVERDPLAMHRAFARFVRARRGRVTAAEWASRTGQTLEEADRALTAALMRFQGDVQVDDDGHLIYTFDELRVQADEDANEGEDLPPIWTQHAKAPPLTGNPSSTNTWVTVANAFNLFMSSALTVYFANAAVGAGAALALLGVIPLLFSVLVFAIPLYRRFQHGRAKKRAAKENARRQSLKVVYESVQGGQARPVSPNSLAPSFADQLLADYQGDVEVASSGQMTYVFPSLAGELEAAQQARQRQGSQVVFGQSVFSSDEEEISLEQAELDDFDARLERELGGDASEFVLDFEVAPQEVPAQSQQRS